MVHGVLARVQLPVVEDLEASTPQQPEHVRGRDVELGRGALGGPVQSVHPAQRQDQALGDALLVRRADLDEVGVAHENQLAGRTEETRRFRDPFEGVAPDRRPVLREGEVERPI